MKILRWSGLSLTLLLAACGAPESGVTPPSASKIKSLNANTPVLIDVEASLTGPSQTYTTYRNNAMETTTLSATIKPAVAQTMKDADYVTLTFANKERISYSNVNGYALIDDDLPLTSTQDMPGLVARYSQYLRDNQTTSGITAQANVAKDGFSCGIFCFFHGYQEAAWPGARIYFDYDSTVTTSQKSYFEEAVRQFNIATGYMPVLINGTNPSGTTMRIATGFIPNYRGGVTAPGYVDQSRVRALGLPSMSIASGVYQQTNVVLHELGHAAGLMHEHQRCDRDNFVTSSYDYYSSASSLVTGVFNYNKLCNMSRSFGPFDYNSLMNYSKYAQVNIKHPSSSFVAGRDYIGTISDDFLGLYTTFSPNDISDGMHTLYPVSVPNASSPIFSAPFFDPSYYKSHYSDVSSYSNQALLTHFHDTGVNVGRNASIFFNPDIYRNQNNLSGSDSELFVSYATNGLFSGLMASLMFDPKTYKAMNSDLANMSYINMANHYRDSGINEGRVASLIFDPRIYRGSQREIDLASLTVNQQFNHYFDSGINESRRGSIAYDQAIYSETSPDLLGISLSQRARHYALYGVNEGRVASFIYNDSIYSANSPDLINMSKKDRLLHYLSTGINEGRSANNFFDVNYYRSHNSDLASFSNKDLVYHYLTNGIYEGRSPSAAFNPNSYRNRYNDLRNFSNFDIAVHFLTHGVSEGRIGN